MKATQTLAHQLGINEYVLARNLEGISHSEGLVFPEPGGNCINWVVGHLVDTRNKALQVVGRQPVFPIERFSMYTGHSDVTFDSDRAIPLTELMEAYGELQTPLAEGVLEMSDEQLASPAPFSPTENPDETVGTLLAGLAFHESYHTGQTGVLRRVIGKEGALHAPEPQMAEPV